MHCDNSIIRESQEHPSIVFKFSENLTCEILSEMLVWKLERH